MSELVTIIIPTYNRARIIGKAIDSALGQTYRNVEVLVVDDGSSDETQPLLERYQHDARLRVVTHAVNRGATAAKNSGLDAARGVFATILDSDDELLPEAVTRLVDTFEQHGPDIGMVFANCIDAETGVFTGVGLDASGPVTFTDAVSERFRGEFCGLWRMSALGDRRFDVRLAGGESLVWHDMYRTTRVWYLHEGLKRYERRSPDSVSRAQLNPAQAARTGLIYQAYLERFGDDLRRVAPGVYAKNLQALALWRILAGHRADALALLWRSIGAARNLRQTAIAVGIAITPRILLHRAMVRRRG